MICLQQTACSPTTEETADIEHEYCVPEIRLFLFSGITAPMIDKSKVCRYFRCYATCMSSHYKQFRVCTAAENHFGEV